MLVRSSTNLLFLLQAKRLRRMRFLPRTNIWFNFISIIEEPEQFDYLDYHATAWFLFWTLLLPGIFFGVGLQGYYSLDLSKRQRVLRQNTYKLKLQIKKDSWFFYGFSIARRLNFLNSTITLWNVFYNEIMEKTFPIFSLWNTLTGPIPTKNVHHFFAPILKKNSGKKRFFYVRNYPRALARITLL